MVGAIARTFATPTSINFWLGITDLNPGKDQIVKFSFSEKATKIVNVKTIRRMTQIFVAFSEKLTFM